MYNLQLTDIASFGKFLNTIDSEWVSVSLADTHATFIMSNSEVFAIYQTTCAHSREETNHNFRVKKNVLKLLAVAGSMSVSVNSDNITLTFSDADMTVNREVRTPYYSDFTASYNENIELLSLAIRQTGFKAGELSKMAGMAKTARSFLEVYDGIACVMSKDGSRVYKTVSNDVGNLCLNYSAISTLFQCSDKWYCVQNCVCAIDGRFGLLVRQARGNATNDYKTVVENASGSAVITKVDFRDVLHILSKISKAKVEFNFRKGHCTLQEDDLVYKIVTPMSELKVSDKYANNSIALNSFILLNFINKLDTSNLLFEVKKHYILIKSEDYVVVCK